LLRTQLQVDIERSFVSGNTKAHGLGWMTTGAWQPTIKVLREQGALKTNLPVREVFTARFSGVRLTTHPNRETGRRSSICTDD
jgi:NitT/TauT family transport system substrate-binding protein